MSKGRRLIKRMTSLFLVLLLSIESFGAVVSDNDGSAFITKAEFDSLKNDFQAQIDNYNTSIDAKIDGAIAAYLAGIRTSQNVTANLLTYDWEEVSCFNGVHKPSFQIPDVSIFIAGGINTTVAWSNYTKMFAMPIWRRYSYTRTNKKTANSYRPLVTGNTEGVLSTAKKDMVWNGVAKFYVETFESTLAFLTTSGDMAGVENPSVSATLKFKNAVDYTHANQYYSDYSSWTSALNPSFLWRASTVGYDDNISLSNKSASNRAVAELETDSEGKDKIYEHIIQYDGADKWCVSNEKHTKTFRKHSDNNLKASNLLNATSKSGNNGLTVTVGQNWNSSNWKYGYHDNSGKRSNMSWADEASENRILSSIGMLSEDQEAKEIYQYAKDKEFLFEKTKVTVKKPKLNEGLPLFYAKQGTKVTWKPYFKKGKKQDSSGNWVDDGTTRVSLFLCIGPFTNKYEIPSSGQLIKMTVGTSTTKVEEAILDEEKENTIKFEMPVDGIVYAKWSQYGDNWQTNKWIKTLDLKKCGTWSYEREN